MNWQPIESLPDGQVVILWQPKDKTGLQPEGMIIGEVDRKHGYLSVSVHMCSGWEWECDLEKPTHWMPLPAPPVEHSDSTRVS